MCGIAGFFTPNASSPDELEDVVDRMTKTMWRRGPDSQGIWTDAEAGIALGHRRLAIMDLSPAGHQPMISHSGRFVIVFNGELYNFRELKADLSGIEWRGGSDTEVLLEAIAAWGVEKALERSNGMFAFALWDREKRELILARDRFGRSHFTWGS